MTQIRNRFNTQQALKEEMMTENKKLPDFFNKMDEIGLIEGLCGSIIIHVIFIILFVLIAKLTGLMFTHLPKPPMPTRDIEFKLVQAEEKPPINKKTKIRSDRNSQAGGKHDPNRIISEPAPAPAKTQSKPQPKQKQAQTLQQKIKQAIQQPKQQPVQKPQAKPKVQQQVAQQPKKPTPVAAPSAKPKVKPSSAPVGVAKPVAPKLATAPKSPFKVGVPPSKGPVGTTYKPQGLPTGGTTGGTRGTGAAPAPKFSSSTGSKTGSNGASGAGGRRTATSRGTGGAGNGGNPSPGNPNGTPGIDAIRQPNWGPYMRDLEQRIKRNWTPPKGDSSKRVVITFTIGRDGRLLSHKVTKSSGVPLADKAAMSAIELTAPFRPLPPEFKGQSVPIEFTFDYNVLNSVLK